MRKDPSAHFVAGHAELEGHGICALIEAGIFGVVWFVEPPSYPASAVSQFACSILFGMGVVACTGVKGFWKRLLLLAPALAVLIVSETIVPRLAEGSSRSIWLYFLGFFFGYFLMSNANPPGGPPVEEPFNGAASCSLAR